MIVKTKGGRVPNSVIGTGSADTEIEASHPQPHLSRSKGDAGFWAKGRYHPRIASFGQHVHRRRHPRKTRARPTRLLNEHLWLKGKRMNILIGALITFIIVILVLYLVNMLPIDGRAKQIVSVIVIIIGIVSLLKYLTVF
jgi:hypothetical protein